MKMCVGLVAMLSVCVLFCGVVSVEGDDGYRLAREASYFIVAPEMIRANQEVQISVSIMELYYSHINVRTIIRWNYEEVASSFNVFYATGTQMIQLKMPLNAEDGNYTLRVEGTANGGLSGYIFENETKLMFDSKQVAVFIETNRAFYHQGQEVLFRIMPVRRNLMSLSGSMDVYIQDATGTTVRRWLSMQTNAGGVLDMTFQLSEQPDYGTWKIRVRAFGHWYDKEFRVDEFWLNYIQVNVSMPLQINEDDFGLAGVVVGNLTMGQPMIGTMKVKLEVRLPPGEQDDDEDYDWPSLEEETRYFPGVGDFMFSMEDIKALVGGSVAGRELYVEAELYDWFWIQRAKGWAISVVHSNDIDLKLLGDVSRTFKPNQTMDIYYAVTNQDKTPINRWRKQITVTGTERSVTGSTTSFEHRFLVSDDGMARFKYKPKEDAEFVRIQAYYDNLSSRSVEVTAYRHYSPTDSYIYITSSTETPQVDKYMVFTVTTNTYVERVYFLITAGGNIITGDSIEMATRQKTFSLALSRDMIPQAHIIVWHIYQDEVIADSMNFFVNGTRLNQVDVQFNRGKDFKGDTVEITSRTDPSSYIGFHGADYQLWAYGYRPFITETEMIRELETFDSHVNKSFQHVWRSAHEQDELIHFPAPSYGIDANTTFVYAGLVVFTDANVTRIQHYCNESTGWHPCMDGTCYFYTQRCDKVRQCLDGQDEMGCEFDDPSPYTPATMRLGLLARHYQMTGHWLWGGHFVMPNGRLDLIRNVPDEPMSWVLNAFAISRNLGFGITHIPAHHEATRSFFMRAQVPDSAIKGEQIGVRVALMNYWDQNLECIVMLHDSDDYRFIAVENFGIVSSYSPRTLRGDIQFMVYLEKGHVYEVQIPILPVKDGCIEIKITANVFIYSDEETLELCTTYDGVTNYLHTPYLLDLISSGSLVLPDLDVPVPELFVRPQERQHIYVPGSPDCKIGIVGDIVGPGFFEDFLDAENTLRKPFGSAEQNMYNFAYNLYQLKYLKATNQLKNDVLSRSLSKINLALQRQMSYMNEDGSFSMFRDYQDHTPSTWVTAFVLKVLHDANDKDWELDFFIETELLSRISQWLCQQQDHSGAFTEGAPLYDRKMWSNETDFEGSTRRSNFSLTAYVLISLAKAGRVSGEAEICRNEAMQKAKTYLETNLGKIQDVYELSITTYALHLVGSSESTKALSRLNDHKRTNPFVYWANKPIPPNDIKVVDTITYYQPRRWYDNEAYGVEATAYAMLTYLRSYMISDSVPIMKWLQTMRNTYAGQASTQDTITAMMALVEYAKLDTNRALYNVRVEVQATAAGNATDWVSLNKDNWPDQQHVDVFPVWGSVRGRAQGTGIALMQMATKVNVEYPHQILPAAEGRYFDVELASFNFTGRNFSIFEIMPCARWARDDISERSGLAVLEIHVPTGYVVTNDVLRKYVQSGEVPTLRRAESYGRKVVYYFDYLKFSERTCVKTRLDRWTPSANMTIQHKLRVYDYYEPGMHNTTLYNTWHLFNLHLCQVCGSFQCPFCRFYNSAPSTAPTTLLTLLSSLAAVWWINTYNAP